VRGKCCASVCLRSLLVPVPGPQGGYAAVLHTQWDRSTSSAWTPLFFLWQRYVGSSSPTRGALQGPLLFGAGGVALLDAGEGGSVCDSGCEAGISRFDWNFFA